MSVGAKKANQTPVTLFKLIFGTYAIIQVENCNTHEILTVMESDNVRLFMYCISIKIQANFVLLKS